MHIVILKIDMISTYGVTALSNKFLSNNLYYSVWKSHRFVKKSNILLNKSFTIWSSIELNRSTILYKVPPPDEVSSYASAEDTC